jgi:succinate dehydrogenase / fumarate reductase flavoprotein subunit
MAHHTRTVWILVIGAGVAWLRCAIELKQAWHDVVLVWDNRLWDSHAKLATGWVNAAQDTQSSYDMHRSDTRRHGAWLCNASMVETLVTQAPQELETLITRWANFEHTQTWELATRLYGPQSQARSFFSTHAVWKEIMDTLARRAKEVDLQFLEHTTITQLIVQDGVIHGAVWINQANDYLTIHASIVVLATWGYTNMYHRSSSRNHESFGDGIAMAYLAGATLQDMEFTQFHPTWLVSPTEFEWMIVKEIQRYQWATLVNQTGERFMRHYDKHHLELASASVVCDAIMDQIRKWNTTYIDTSTCIEEHYFSHESDTIAYLTKHNPLIQVAPTAHFSMWWIAVDPDTCESSITWLYAIGECTAWLHGANRLPWNSIMESLVFGAKLAKHLGSITLKIPHSSPSIASIPEAWTLSGVYVIDKIRKIMLDNASVRVSAWHLNSAIHLLEALEKELEDHGLKMWLDVYQTVVQHKRCQHMIALAHTITKAMQHRLESRGSFSRSDHPQSSDTYQRHSLLTFQDWKHHHLSRKDADLPSITILRALQQYSATTQYWLIE